MAYQSIATPAQVMIQEMAATRRFLGRIGTFFGNIGVKMMENSAGGQRVEAVKRLQALSDAELAEKNIKRDDIVNHVFKDLYYL